MSADVTGCHHCTHHGILPSYQPELMAVRQRPPIRIPEEVFERVSALCLALPEVTVRVDASRVRARSTAHSFEIRRRSFCLLVAKEGPSGEAVPLVVLRADFEERDALLSVGHPFFVPRVGRGRVGVLLTEGTDWEEIRELVLREGESVVATGLLTLETQLQRGDEISIGQQRGTVERVAPTVGSRELQLSVQLSAPAL